MSGNDQKICILTRNLDHRSREGWEQNSNSPGHPMCGPADRLGEDCSGAGGWSGGNRISLSDEVSPGEVRYARERTVGPIPVVRLGAAFPGAIQGTRDQDGRSIGKGLINLRRA